MKPFKLIIAGGREFDDYEMLSDALIHLNTTVLADYNISLVSGMARGADALGYMFAHKNNVKVFEFPAQWKRHGKRAGFIRNEYMGRFSDGLLAFHDKKSRGTKHMIEFMTSLGKPIYLYEY